MTKTAKGRSTNEQNSMNELIRHAMADDALETIRQHLLGASRANPYLAMDAPVKEALTIRNFRVGSNKTPGDRIKSFIKLICCHGCVEALVLSAIWIGDC